jgi:predicted alpha/beta superfamily hydrolase
MVACMELIELGLHSSAILEATRYFEVESERVGARFGVWVTTPARFALDEGRRYPAIYQADGNLATPVTAPALWLLPSDPIAPIQPFIQVSVGYVGDDAKRMLAVRARDLLPPGEALPAGTDETSMAALVELGVLDQVGAELYLHNLRNPAADRFLAFLSDELHPAIAAEYPIDEDALGLYGYSYGGLFATYAALNRPRFRRIGAGSPGILPRVSRIFELYRAELEADADHSGRMLHMTVCEREITVPSVYQNLVGAGSAEFMTLAGRQPLRGLDFTSRIVSHESHATGNGPAWFSFLRTCYPAGPDALTL